AAGSYLEESLALFRQVGDPWGLARVQHYLGELERARGNYARAGALYEESAALYGELGHQNTRASVLHNLGYVAQRLGDGVADRVEGLPVRRLTAGVFRSADQDHHCHRRRRRPRFSEDAAATSAPLATTDLPPAARTGTSRAAKDVVIDGLAAFARRWGTDRAVGFFSRVCPRLFDLGALAYWQASREELGRSAIDRITKVTQCVLELGEDHLRVGKAEGRPASVQGRLLRLRLEEERIVLEDERALGRLGRGLEQLRRQRNLTQTDLARLGRVSPSAISQAEGGRRGLSLDTLLTLADGLGVGLDELLASTPLPGYVLGRLHRGSAGTQTPLLDDPKAGLRTYLVRLGPAETATPEITQKGPELVLVASGLVQVTIGDDTPVMRAGDVALATRVPISRWRNLVGEPALIFWVLRD
ncbi:MAG: helix-turn-helix domain-containing protein, partial [Actinobacteria bacterium]|nr:helix-turn-helix domain-containing protein [Actinomycetota bacterium]